MKAEVNKERIVWAIQKLQRNPQKQLSLPILEAVYIEASDNTLTFRTTNLHVGTEVTIPAKIKSEGNVAVSFNLFSQIFTNLKDEKISVFLDGGLFVLETEHSKFSLATLNADEFPVLPKIDGDFQEFSLDIEKLIEGIQSVMYAAAQSDIKPEISSVYIYPSGSEVVFVSTDSFRLAEKKIVPQEAVSFPGIIFPIKNAQEFVRIFLREEGECVVKVSETQISFETDSIYFVSRIVDGVYPDYRQIIPKEEGTLVEFLHHNLTSSLKLVHLLSDDFHQVFFKTEKEKEFVLLSSKNSQLGESEIKVPAHIEGSDIELKFNYKYVSDVLNHPFGETVTFTITESHKPFVIRYKEDPSFLYLVMPMR